MKNNWRMKTMAGVLCLTCMPCQLLTAPTSAEELLYDTGLNYTEQTGYDLNYCDCGYTGTRWINAKPGQVWSTGDISSYTLLLIDIGAYSSGINGSGKDYELDAPFFEGLRNTLESAKKNGTNVGIRLRYDSNGKENPEPASFDMVLKHIEALGSSGLLDEYEEVISFIESGLVGAWGEQWGGKYTSLAYKAQVLDAFLNITPDDISVSVRTPNTVREWLSTYCGIKTTASDMHYEITDPEQAAKAKRIGLYNDGYMGSNSDLGTFSDRAGETAWIATAATYGGEFSGSDEFRISYDTWQPENALPEMYSTHLMRINGNLYRSKTEKKTYDSRSEAQNRLNEVTALYEKMGLGWYDAEGSITEQDGKYITQWNWIGYDAFTFDEALDKKSGVSCDNSAFYGESVWQFMRSHLGYRYVLKKSEMNRQASAGGTLNMQFAVENTGFANAPREKEVEIILSNGRTVYTLPTEINAQTWLSGTRQEEALSLSLPKTMPGGQWDVYMRISNTNQHPEDNDKYACRFANAQLIYDEALAANYMGSITIDGTEDITPPELENERTAGYYPTDASAMPIDNETQIKLLDNTYTFTESDHYGFTFLYRMTGVTEPMQLGNWYLSFSDNNNNYGSAYTTYGLNTRNQEITADGYYAMSIPFYGCVFNFPSASTANSTILKELTINDSRNYWSADTFTKVNGNQQPAIQPLGFVEGMPSGYDVTFCINGKSYNYTGTYDFQDVKTQTIKNLPAVTALSLLDQPYEEQYTGADGNTYHFCGFTTKQNDGSCLITEDTIAIGKMTLYPYYEIDKDATNFNQTTLELTNGADNQTIRYVLDEKTMTASVGDGSAWKNNSGFSGETGQLMIPAYVVSDGKKYRVTAISAHAFADNTKITSAILPDTLTEIGENAFCLTTELYVYEGGQASRLLSESDYPVTLMSAQAIAGDVDSNGVFEIADGILLRSWLTAKPVTINETAADCNADGFIDIYDLALIKRWLCS